MLIPLPSEFCSPPFRSSVLEPSLDLGIGHLQVFGHLCALGARKVFLRKQSNVIREGSQLRDLPVCETSFPIHRFEVERTRFLAFSVLAVFCSDRDGRFGVEGKGRLEQKNI